MGHLHLCATFQEASLFDFHVHCLGQAIDTFNMISKKSYQSRTQRERIKELISKGLRNEWGDTKKGYEINRLGMFLVVVFKIWRLW